MRRSRAFDCGAAKSVTVKVRRSQVSDRDPAFWCVEWVEHGDPGIEESATAKFGG